MEFLPLTAHDGSDEPPEIPAELLGCLTSPHAVTLGLAQGGVLSEEELREHVRWLGSSAGPRDGVPVPQRGRRLLVSSVVAGLLSRTDLLGACCDYYSVVMPENERAGVEVEIQRDRGRIALADWGQELVSRITHRLETGSLKFIPPAERPDNTIDEPNRFAIDCLLDLLHNEVSGGLVCSDDQFVNKYPRFGQCSPTSTADLVAALRKARRIPRNQYFGILHVLRSKNYCYFPLSDEEILYRLHRAQVQHGKILETEELAALRSWWGARCAEREAFRDPGKQADGSGQLAFLVNSRRSIIDAIRGTWSDRQIGAETRAARTRWLFDSLFVGLAEIRHHGEPDPQERDSQLQILAGTDVALLCSAALSLDWTRPLRGAKEPAAVAYLDWLIENYVGPVLAVDRHLSEAAAAGLRDFLEGVLNDAASDSERESILRLFPRFVEKLPAPLNESLGRDPAMARLFNVRRSRAVEVGDYHFEFEAFWEGVAAALEGRRSHIRPQQGGYPLSLRRGDGSEDSPGVAIVRADASIVATMVDPLFGLLFSKRAEILAALQRSPHWTDGDRRSLAELADELIRLKPVQRVEQIESLASRSAADLYHQLQPGLKTNHRLWLDQIAPRDLGPVARYFRLTGADGANFRELWQSAAAALIEELGVDAALDRIRCIPSRIPQLVIEHLDAMGDLEASSLLRRKLGASFCPISLLNLLSVSARSRLDRGWREPLAREIIGTLCGEEFRPDFELTGAIAWRLSNRAAAAETKAGMRRDVRLAAIWGHASRVVDIVRREVSPSDRVTRWIASTASDTADLFHSTRADFEDFWDPRRVSAPHLLPGWSGRRNRRP